MNHWIPTFVGMGYRYYHSYNLDSTDPLALFLLAALLLNPDIKKLKYTSLQDIPIRVSLNWL